MARRIVTHRFRPSKRIVQHVYGGPNAQSRRRTWRPSGGLVFIVAGLAVIYLAHLGGHW